MTAFKLLLRRNFFVKTLLILSLFFILFHPETSRASTDENVKVILWGINDKVLFHNPSDGVVVFAGFGADSRVGFDWQIEKSGNFYRLRAVPNNGLVGHYYLAHTAAEGEKLHIVNADDTSNRKETNWEVEVTGDSVLFKVPKTEVYLGVEPTKKTKATLVRHKDTATAAQQDHLQWRIAWKGMPQFAIDELDPIKDWSTVLFEPLGSDLRFAQLAFQYAPDNDASVAIKRRWAKQFPGIPADNAVTNAGTGLTIWSATYLNAESGTGFRRMSNIWARPGEEITLYVPDAMVEDQFFVSVGPNSLNKPFAYNGKTFARAPFPIDKSIEIKRDAVTSETHPITQQRTNAIRIKNPFGGVVFIEKGDAFGQITSDQKIHIKGGTPMTHYRSGKLEHPSSTAPWVLLEGKRNLFLLPKEIWKDAETSTSNIVEFWDHVAGGMDAFVGTHWNIYNPSFVFYEPHFDFGVAEKGTIAGPKSLMEEIVSPRKGFQVMFQELGHLRQRGKWGQLAGSGEVTNEIVAAYAADQLFGKSLGVSQRHVSSESPHFYWAIRTFDDFFKITQQERQKRWAGRHGDNLGANGHYGTEVEIRLGLNLLALHFGWDIYKTLFESYESIPSAKFEAHQDRTDMFVKTLSDAAGNDLTEYLEIWGAVASNKVKEEIAKKFPDNRSQNKNSDKKFRPNEYFDVGFVWRNRFPLIKMRSSKVVSLTMVSDDSLFSGSSEIEFMIKDLRIKSNRDQKEPRDSARMQGAVWPGHLAGTNVLWVSPSKDSDPLRMIDVEYDVYAECSANSCGKPKFGLVYEGIVGIRGMDGAWSSTLANYTNPKGRTILAKRAFSQFKTQLPLPRKRGAYEICAGAVAYDASGNPVTERIARDGLFDHYFDTPRTVSEPLPALEKEITCAVVGMILVM